MSDVQIQYLLEPTPDYTLCALRTVKHIHENTEEGNILLFLPTPVKIEQVCNQLRKAIKDIEPVPFYSELKVREDGERIGRAPFRKCIVSTHTANSLAEWGVVYVIDSGIMKQAGFNPRAGLKTLLTTTVSQQTANERANMASGNDASVCFRLYDELTFEKSFIPLPVPDILAQDACAQILRYKTGCFSQEPKHPRVDRPHPEVYLRGLQDLVAMGYLSADGTITKTGRRASKLPFHPAWYNAIVEGHKMGCSVEIVTLAALASSQHSIFLRPYRLRYAADAARARFACPVSDHIAQLNAYNAYTLTKAQGDMNMSQWCFDAFLVEHVLLEVQKRSEGRQLHVCELLREEFEDFDTLKSCDHNDKEWHVKIRKALARGFFYRSAIYTGPGKDIYRTVHDDQPAGLHPDSSLVGINHEWVIYDTFTYSYKQYIQTVTAVEPEWLIDLPYFQDDKLPRRRGGGQLKQPQVKASLEKARFERQRATG